MSGKIDVKRSILFLFVWLILSVSGVKAVGTTYYLDCNGSDSNSGITETAAWRNLSKVNGMNFLAGDRLLLKRGCTWTGTLTLTESGTQAANIYVGSYGTGEMPILDVKTDNTAGIDLSGSYITVDGVYVRATSAVFEAGCQSQPKGHMVGADFRSGAAFNTITNSKFTGAYAGVFLRSGSHNNRIVGNTFNANNMMSPLDTASDNDAGAFGVLIWGDDNEIAQNVISDQDACSYDYVRDGAAVEIYGGQRNLIRHNKVSSSDAFTELGNSRSSDNVYVYNLFYSTLNKSIFLVTRGAANNYGPVYGTKVFNNVVYLTGAQSQGFVCHAGCSTSVLTMKNNIFRAGWKAGYADAAFGNSNNIYYKGQTQFTLGPGDAVADPLFVDEARLDFHLKPTSKAINAGAADTLSTGVAIDLDNNYVPVSGVVDIGAYEYGSVASGTSPTPTPAPSGVRNGDVNGDGRVDFADVEMLAGKWLMVMIQSDGNDQYIDGKVNSLDLAVVMQRMNVSPTAIPTLVPTVTLAPTAVPTGAPTPTRPVATPTPTPTPPVTGGNPITVAVVGDINPSGVTSVTSASGKNAASITAANVNAFINVGDLQYTYGTCSAFLAAYDKLWGGLNPIMYPTAGPTHDWDATNSNGQQYQLYLSGTCPGQTSKPAKGDPDPKKPYSFDIGKWHFVQLSSGCWRYSSTCSGSAETAWLATDLANAVATGHPYIVAFWHEPYWTSSTSTHSSNTPAVKPWIDLLYQYKAKLVLHGHQHGYERFLPQNNLSVADANGIQGFIVGTGGIGFYPWNNKANNSAVQQTGTYGWLKLVLRDDGSYDWQFVPTSGGTFTDTGTRPATGM